MIEKVDTGHESISIGDDHVVICHFEPHLGSIKPLVLLNAHRLTDLDQFVIESVDDLNHFFVSEGEQRVLSLTIVRCEVIHE